MTASATVIVKLWLSVPPRPSETWTVTAWLPKVDCVAVELHDDTHFGSCSDVFYAAISRRDFLVSRSRELTVCRRP